jgi:hypothetical protein
LEAPAAAPDEEEVAEEEEGAPRAESEPAEAWWRVVEQEAGAAAEWPRADREPPGEGSGSARLRAARGARCGGPETGS